MHSTGPAGLVETQDHFFCHFTGRSAPPGLAIVHWIGCINAIKLVFGSGQCVSLGLGEVTTDFTEVTYYTCILPKALVMTSSTLVMRFKEGINMAPQATP